ncbi:MAG TPA: SLC13 family permease [Nocardioides sp.]|nr:SLC13 family permease [Nocardioides sp.]
MPPLPDIVVVLALGGMLAVAFGHPRGRVEAAVGVVCAGAALATGLLTLDEARGAVDSLAPVVAFLVTILVVSDVCARAGVFTAAAQRVGRWSGASAVRLFTGVFVLAAVVTATLSLDATVVLLTPVVLTASMARAVPDEPGTYACLRMANSASLLLPVSNLTNLLALPHLDLTFTEFALRMAPVLAVVLAVEYVGLRLLFRDRLSAMPRPDQTPSVPVPTFPVVVVVAMLAGFAVVSPFGGQPWWVSLAAAVVLAGWAVRRRLARPIHLVHAAHPGFAVWVLALGVVVAGLAEGFLGDVVRDLVPSSTSLGALLVIAVLATVLANALTNLSATLLLVPVVAPLGSTAVLAALLGLNIGSGLTWTGSLANQLWRRTLRRQGRPPGNATFHRVSLTITPVALLAAVVALWLLS